MNKNDNKFLKFQILTLTLLFTTFFLQEGYFWAPLKVPAVPSSHRKHTYFKVYFKAAYSSLKNRKYIEKKLTLKFSISTSESWSLSDIDNLDICPYSGMYVTYYFPENVLRYDLYFQFLFAR